MMIRRIPAETRQDDTLVIPGFDPISDAALAARRIREPLKPTAVQKPCDVGLFSDESAQLDLVDMARRDLSTQLDRMRR